MGKKKKRGGSGVRQGDENQPVNVTKEEDLFDKKIGKSIETEQEKETKKKYTSKDLMARVEQYVENFDYEMALKFCKKALTLDAENIEVLEGAGNVCAEIGDIENAKKYFLKAVEVQPNKGHVKYLYLGQLSEGKESVSYYETAISLMEKEIKLQENTSVDDEKNLNNESESKKLSQRDVSAAYCSLAELYMTDLCMEENAESMCERYCGLAMEADDRNLDASVGITNFLLSKSDMDAAKVAVEKGFELWSTISKEISEENLPEVVSYEARVTLVKLLIEVESYDKISGITDQLIEENEDDIRIWYYLGLAKCLLKSTTSPRFYLEKALHLYEKSGYDDKDMLAHINELLESCPQTAEEHMDTVVEEENENENENESDDESGGMDVE